ncbi:MAG: hypothetical protein LBP22_15940 [Deltaproteobacteria bacterium]|nr:hypothetical protein [Deltaproteobacteria bacterium]
MSRAAGPGSPSEEELIAHREPVSEALRSRRGGGVKLTPVKGHEQSVRRRKSRTAGLICPDQPEQAETPYQRLPGARPAA